MIEENKERPTSQASNEEVNAVAIGGKSGWLWRCRFQTHRRNCLYSIHWHALPETRLLYLLSMRGSPGR
jgi:hypothetical protein